MFAAPGTGYPPQSVVVRSPFVGDREVTTATAQPPGRPDKGGGRTWSLQEATFDHRPVTPVRS